MAVINAHIVAQYQDIDSADFHQRLFFIEEHIIQIDKLDEKSFYFFQKEKIQILFELGKYDQVLNVVDELICYCISDESATSDLLFEKLVFLKASSLLNLGKVDQAISLSKELVGISPFDKLYHKLLRESLKRGADNRNHDFKILSFWLTGFIFLGSIVMCLGFIERQYFSSRTIWFVLVGIPLVLLLTTYIMDKILVTNHIEKELNRLIRSKQEKRILGKPNLG